MFIEPTFVSQFRSECHLSKADGELHCCGGSRNRLAGDRKEVVNRVGRSAQERIYTRDHRFGGGEKRDCGSDTKMQMAKQASLGQDRNLPPVCSARLFDYLQAKRAVHRGLIFKFVG